MALHPFLSVLIQRPELVLDHLAGYAVLASEEAVQAGYAVARRAIAWVVAVLAFIVFLVLAGVAAMLGAIEQHIHWMLLLVPGTALALAVVAFLQTRRKLPRAALAELRAQWDADLEALRALGVA